jgi:hypothetical protein
MRAAYRLTVRSRGAVKQERHPSLDAALTALESRLDALAREERRRATQVLGRTYEPVRQVAARGEIAGPGRLRAGVDLRGDGSAEAFTGRLRRRLVAAAPGETAYDALRRAVTARRP